MIEVVVFAFTTPIGTPPAAGARRLSLPFEDPTDPEAAPLRCDWPALVALTRYAGRATWLFGNRAAVLECVNHRGPSCDRPRSWADPSALSLDFANWTRAVSRPSRGRREIAFFAGSGPAIATVRFDDCDPALDELLWLLMDDAPKPVAARLPKTSQRPADARHLKRVFSLLERREDFERLLIEHGLRRHDALTFAGPHVATRLLPDALPRALREAVVAGIRVRVRLRNDGGSVSWTPLFSRVTAQEPGYVELRWLSGRMHVNVHIGPTWAVYLSGAGSGGPAIEAESDTDGGWVRLDAAEPADREAWRSLCLRLAQE